MHYCYKLAAIQKSLLTGKFYISPSKNSWHLFTCQDYNTLTGYEFLICIMAHNFLLSTRRSISWIYKWIFQKAYLEKLAEHGSIC